MTRAARARAPRRLEKTEQADTVKLLQTIGAAVYVIGTRRPRGKPCATCGAFVPEHQGTCQTPGLPDLVAFLPGHGAGAGERRILFVEQKARTGRYSPDQLMFRALVEQSPAAYIGGTLDDVVFWLEARGYVRRGPAWQSRSEWETK